MGEKDTKMKFLILIKILQATEISIQFERESVSKLWLNGTGDLGCYGTQCNVVNVKCEVTAAEIASGQVPTFKFHYQRNMVITRSLYSTNDAPPCNGTYLHQCGKIGVIDENTCVEYCQQPVIVQGNTAKKTLQVQNYFSLKDDGQYTCTAVFDNGNVVQAVQTMKYPNPECNSMCIFGIVLSVTIGYIPTLLVMTTIGFGEDTNKVDRCN